MADKAWAKGQIAICTYCEYELSSWPYLRGKLKRLKLLSYDGNRPVLNKQGWDEYMLRLKN